MNLKEFNKGILFSSLGSFWWGAIGVIYFSYFSFICSYDFISRGFDRVWPGPSLTFHIQGYPFSL